MRKSQEFCFENFPVNLLAPTNQPYLRFNNFQTPGQADQKLSQTLFTAEAHIQLALLKL